MKLRSLLPALLLLLAAGAARAGDPSVDAAVRADDINQEHCASLYDASVERAASATVAVAEAWSRVDDVYAETGASYLLFWRGVLAQCLGREEAALDDLNAFVQSQEGSTVFSSLVRLARSRVRRLGDRMRLGQGAAGAFVTRGAPLELAASYSAGSGFHELACVDADAWGSANTTCVGAVDASSTYAAARVPVRLQAAIDGFPARGLGLGARLDLTLPAPGGLPDDRSPGPTVELTLGPQIRILESVSSGRRPGWLRIEARFALSFVRMSPLAGSAKYAALIGGYLDGGTWDLFHPGGAIRIEGALELSPRAALLLSGRFAGYVPMPGDAARRTVQGADVELVGLDGVRRQERVEVLPELVRTARLSAGGRVGLALPAGRGVALGPFVGVDFQHATMTFPNLADDCWLVGPEGSCEEEDGEQRKVFSTRRHDLYVTAGIDVRFAVSRPETSEAAP